MEKTAVEWLIEYFSKYVDMNKHLEEIEQAKEMEKQQIIESHAVGRLKECSGINTDGEQYYNQTFKQQAQ